MSSILTPGILREVAHDRFLPRIARAAVGVGERRSRAVGAGLEFADFRPYQVGDDIRYLDRHVLARLGQEVVRQYALDKQLEVTILLDGSGSMLEEGGGKFRFAQVLMAGLSYIALRTGDRVRLGVASDGRLETYPTLTAQAGLREALGWIERLRPAGRVSLAKIAMAAGQRPDDGLLVVVSDWLTDDAAAALRTWGRSWTEVVALQVLARDELEPMGIDGGALLVDSETAEELHVLGDTGRGRYAAALEAWREELAGVLRRLGGHWYSFPSDLDPRAAFAALRRGRLIG